MSLVQLRQLRGLTQTQLAERLGQTQASVARIEHATEPRFSTLCRIIEALGGTLELRVTFEGFGPIHLSNLVSEQIEPSLWNRPGADERSRKLRLARRIVGALNKRRLTNFRASERTGRPEADFVRLRRLETDAFRLEELHDLLEEVSS